LATTFDLDVRTVERPGTLDIELDFQLPEDMKIMNGGSCSWTNNTSASCTYAPCCATNSCDTCFSTCGYSCCC